MRALRNLAARAQMHDVNELRKNIRAQSKKLATYGVPLSLAVEFAGAVLALAVCEQEIARRKKEGP